MKKLILILVCFGSITLFAQKKEADKKFKKYEYSEAIPLYKEYLEKNPKNYDAAKNLALSYKFTNNITAAIETYKSLLGMKQAVPDDWYDLVQLLRINGNLAEAKIYALQYQEKSNGEKAQNLIKSIEMFDELMSGMGDYTVVNKTGQYSQSVFSPEPYKGGFVVTAESVDGAKSEWTGRGITKLYLTDTNFNSLVPFAGEVMTKYSDGPISL